LSNADRVRDVFGREGERRSWTVEQMAASIAELSAPDVVYEEDPSWPGSGLHHGLDAVIARFREYAEVLPEFETEVDAIEEHGDRVLLVYRHSGRSSAGIPFEQLWHYVYEFDEGGRAARLRAFIGPEQAGRAFAGRE
jgi:ketosteroid isomerase-like protein